jgi:elongator complex protein 3
LVRGTELAQLYRHGQWQPYTFDVLKQVLRFAMLNTPRYCRLARVVRDICSGDILVGNKQSNFRQIVEQSIVEQEKRLEEIRSREIGRQRFEIERLALRDTAYRVSAGQEHFLELVTPNDKLVGFLRLLLPDSESYLTEITNSALIREVHIYGGSVALHARDHAKAQHRGLGARLISSAVDLARLAGFADLAVIAAVGTRAYYRSLGFHDGSLYQHRALK